MIMKKQKLILLPGVWMLYAGQAGIDFQVDGDGIDFGVDIGDP